MSKGLQFFTPFSRTFEGPLDVDQVFDTITGLQEYLENPARFAGQIATCKEKEGSLFILSNDRSQWLEHQSADATSQDMHLAFPVLHTLEVTVEHNMDKKPAVQVLDGNGNKVLAAVTHIDEKTTRISFLDYFSGIITFN